jgi:hypothetical protein
MDKKLKLPTNKNFGIVFFVVFLIIGLWPLLAKSEIRYWSILVSIIFLFLGFKNSKLLNPLNKLWFKFGILLGKIVSPVIMVILFFFVVTPTAYIMRILKKDLLSLKFSNDKTYWIKKSEIKSKMHNQF